MLSSLVTFTGEIADTKVVLATVVLLHKEKKKKNLYINKQELSVRQTCELLSSFMVFVFQIR